MLARRQQRFRVLRRVQVTQWREVQLSMIECVSDTGCLDLFISVEVGIADSHGLVGSDWTTMLFG